MTAATQLPLLETEPLTESKALLGGLERECIRIRAALLLDDGIYLLRRDGTLEPVLPGGRPGGVCAHSTATATRP